MWHYLSLSKKLGGLAALAALVALAGCGGDTHRITKPANLASCQEFEQANVTERASAIKLLYKYGQGSSGEVLSAVTGAQVVCQAQPSERLVNIPQIAGSRVPAPETPTTPTYPVVHFATDTNGGEQEVPEPGQTAPVNPDPTKGEWPFTVQMLSLKTSLNGFAPGIQTPRGYEVMMFEANITSQITGRTVPTPLGIDIKVLCSSGGKELTPVYSPKGYNITGSEADEAATDLEFGNGQPIGWLVEWQVKEGINLSEVTCEFEWEGQKSLLT